jgi:serine/threonine protein kinase
MDIQILTDLSFTSNKNKTWTFGDIVNTGSFGTIYQDASNKTILIKIGKETVFFEKAVLRKIASDSIDHIPVMIDSGSLSSLGLKDIYFIAMPNYGKSLHSMLLVSPLEQNLLNFMMSDMLFALSYLSSKKYMHLDVTPNNIVFNSQNEKWYLIDYGMAKNFRNEIFKKDPKLANNGTPLYMARDAHRGIMSRKCDLESLFYTMLVAEDIRLPWEKIKNKRRLLISKNKFFKDIECLKIPTHQKTFALKVDLLEPSDCPDYPELQDLFISKILQ